MRVAQLSVLAPNSRLREQHEVPFRGHGLLMICFAITEMNVLCKGEVNMGLIDATTVTIRRDEWLRCLRQRLLRQDRHKSYRDSSKDFTHLK